MQPNGTMPPLPTPGQPPLPQPQQQPVQPFAPNPYAQMSQTPQQPVATYKPSNHMPALIISLSLTLLLLFAAAGFGAWAYMGRQDYKNNSDKKVAAAVDVAKQQEDAAKEKDFAEREKNPLRQYKGPADYGSLGVMYPKTWSAFVTEQSSGGIPVDGYFHPSYVPGIQSGTAFALRLQVLQQSYAQSVKQFDPATRKGITVTPYNAPKVAGVVGVRVDGNIGMSGNNNVSGSMVILPLRDKTIEISTQSPTFVDDFNNIILANFTFVP